MTAPLARTSLEAHLYIDLTPCECGELKLPRSSAAITLPDGSPGARYTGTCPSCGRSRVFEFRLPEREFQQMPDEVTYGVRERSELIDAAQWVAVAARYSAMVPARPRGLTGEARRIARTRLAAAIAAITEAERFLPDDADDMPESAFWSAEGRAAVAAGLDRFHRWALAEVRSSYEDRFDDTGSRWDEARSRETPEDEAYRERRHRLRLEWAERHGITDIHNDRHWTEAQRLELRRAERELAGLDVATGASLLRTPGALGAFDSVGRAIFFRFAEEPAERARRTAAAEAVRARWCEQTGCAVWGVDDDLSAIPDDDLPPPESAWAMVRAAREAAGMDPRTGDFVK
ncbi:hypothetical protein GCM10010168_69930 [Actinoplanes ianthinogenes]|uniref:Uncharacterized protein n=1 Tax=Actinoplanes ianthinogenes TaxID=122358 RepID=A0ABM7M0V4_9ACTN|nr:hypothetical protein [Actinoplanes ianthinogenes]BCJ45192.1 hypothetical protein Aiant_58490 [Actinoplanes ianthinogenes]GGR41185.1 hypothetical protein GCM10010168_69930 [Actinoplanes ianthinogenes]